MNFAEQILISYLVPGFIEMMYYNLGDRVNYKEIG